MSVLTTTNTSTNHIYSNGGVYNVTLTVFAPSNSVTPSCTISQTVLASCSASTSTCNNCDNLNMFIDNSACSPTIYCNNSSTGIVGSFVWNFGDGSPSFITSSTNAFPHTYTTSGNYVVSLEAYSSNSPDPSIPCGKVSYTNSIGTGPCLGSGISDVGMEIKHLGTCGDISINANYPHVNSFKQMIKYGDGNSTIITSTTTTHHYTSAGMYTVTYDTYDVNTSTVTPISTMEYIINVCNGCSLVTGFNDIFENIVASIYPNPIQNELVIELDSKTIKTEFTYELVDAMGKIILANKLLNQKNRVNTTDIGTGFYILNIKNEHKGILYSSKLIK